MEIKKKKVSDIMHLVVEQASVINQRGSVSQLFKCFLSDPRTRHVYVVNDENVLIGSIRLNDLVETIDPYINSLDNGFFDKFMSDFTKKKCSDFMLKKFLFLKEDSLISEMIDIMIDNKVNELPVVDNNNHITGEVNFLELIKYFSDNEYLAEKNKRD